MFTKDKRNVLFLNNGEPLCKFCATLLEEKSVCDYSWEDRYSDRWTEYQCECNDWNITIDQDETLDRVLISLNKGLEEKYKEYIAKRNEAFDTYRKTSVVYSFIETKENKKLKLD